VVKETPVRSVRSALAGQMGDEQVTVKNLKIAIVDADNNLIGVTGAVPGPRKGIVIIKEAVNHG
jgi:large subunit ribosomal protein L3